MTIAAANFEDLVQFYADFLERSPRLHQPGRYAEFQMLDLRLGIFKPQSSQQSEFVAQSSGGVSLCLEVENLEAAIDHLTAMGYPPSGEVSIASHGKEIYAYDPEGNRLILHESV